LEFERCRRISLMSSTTLQHFYNFWKPKREKIRLQSYGKWCCSEKLQTCCSQQTAVFWNVLLCSLVEIYWHLAQTCCLHFLFHYGSSKFLHSVIDNIYYTTQTHKPKDTNLITVKALRTSNLTAVHRLWMSFFATNAPFSDQSYIYVV